MLQNLLSSKETPKGEKENTHATPENSLPSDSGHQSAGMADVFSASLFLVIFSNILTRYN